MKSPYDTIQVPVIKPNRSVHGFDLPTKTHIHLYMHILHRLDFCYLCTLSSLFVQVQNVNVFLWFVNTFALMETMSYCLSLHGCNSKKKKTFSL